MLGTCVLLLLISAPGFCQSPQNIFKGPDGGYSNVIVAIHRSIPENAQLIEKIKEIFTEASPKLLKATFGGAYFKQVTIALPNTWSYKPSYENSTEDLYAKAHFKVEGPTVTHGDEPYTLQDKGCEEPGLYTHWTPNYLLEDFESKWPAKIGERKELRLIQEWARLRYGVFEEYGYPGDPRYPSVYKKNQDIFETKCSESVIGYYNFECPVQGTEGIQVGDPSNCSYIPAQDQSGASIMFTASVSEIYHFCDDSAERKHNSKAPNKQNDKCEGRSTWNVISVHEDFKNSRTQIEMSKYAQEPWESDETKFRVLRAPGAADARMVFVLDTSGSMKGRPMELLHSAASRALLGDIPDGSRVGIVAFSTSSRILSPLTVINQKSREELVNKLPRKDDAGYTAIGKGLLKGLDVLVAGGGKPEGTRIILVTDGEENVGPKIDEVIPSLTAPGVEVMAVAFGKNATHKLERLALATKGKVFFFPDLSGKKPTSALDSAFLESTTLFVSEEQQPIRIINERLNLTRDWLERPLLVEESLGKNLVITVTATSIDPVQLTLTDPNGRSLGPGNSKFQKDNDTLQRVRLEVSKAIKGVWRLSLRSEPEPTTVELSVLSHQQDFDPTVKPARLIRVRAWVDDIQPSYPSPVRVMAQVVQGGQEPVRDATVTAAIARPNNNTVDLILKDNGAGADTTKGDGIYSAYFTQFTGDGRYAVFIRMVTFQDDSKTSDNLRARRSIPIIEGRVERVVDAGSFRLDSWSPRDEIPPSKVTDLLASSISENRVLLTWTAPGDNMDDGQAARMDIRVSQDPDFLRQNFSSSALATDWLVDNLTQPLGGETQQTELFVPELYGNSTSGPTTYYFALRARDQAGNVADVSNVASVTLASKPPTNVPLTTEERSILVPAVVGAAAFLVLIVVAAMALMVYSNKKGKEKKKKGYVGVPH